jgi:hypothetical protein
MLVAKYTLQPSWAAVAFAHRNRLKAKARSSIMGAGRWDQSAWSAYASRNVHGRSRDQIFAARRMDAEFDPARIRVRESRDSEDNPLSTPIILASDVTGSMGMIAHELMNSGLNTLATEIYERQPVTDPHIMVMAVGDARTDSAPLQATQFEADIRIADQVRRLWLEGGGGGNGGESYSAAHVFAGLRTDSDSLSKRGKKGYLFTIGDEPIHDGMTRDELTSVFGEDPGRGLSARDCLALAKRSYDVFHVVILQGFAGNNLGRVLRSWKPLLPGRLLLLDDHAQLAQVVVSAIQIAEGADPDTVSRSWSGPASAAVARAVQDIRAPSSSFGDGLRRLLG